MSERKVHLAEEAAGPMQRCRVTSKTQPEGSPEQDSTGVGFDQCAGCARGLDKISIATEYGLSPEIPQRKVVTSLNVLR